MAVIKPKSNNTLSKTGVKSYVKDFDFEIDSSVIKKIDSKNFTSYTLLINKEKNKREKYFDNLLITIDTLKVMNAYLVRYDLKSKVKKVKEHDSYGFEYDQYTLPLVRNKKLSEEDTASQSKQSTSYAKATSSGTWESFTFCEKWCDWGGTPHIAGPACEAANDGRTYFRCFTYTFYATDTNDTTYHSLEELIEAEDGYYYDEHGGGGGTNPYTSPVLPDDIDERDLEVLADLITLPNLSDLERDYLAANINLMWDIDRYLYGDRLDNNGENTQEALDFSVAAIGAVMHGGEVDFFDQFINELTDKALCVYNKLKSSSTGFKNAIKKFDGDFPVSHISFKVNNTLPTGNYGITNPPSNYNITIEFSNTQMGNISDLGAAVAFAHEMIHAEIFRKMLSAAQKGDLNLGQYTTQNRIDYMNSLLNNFPGLYDYYWKRYHPTWNHNLMAQHYRSTIADIAQQFDGNTKDRQVYEI